MKHTISTLAAALELATFDADALSGQAGVPRATAQTVLSRRNKTHPGWATQSTNARTGSGRPRLVYTLTPEGRRQIEAELLGLVAATSFAAPRPTANDPPLGLLRAEAAMRELEAVNDPTDPDELAHHIQSNLSWARKELDDQYGTGAAGADRLDYLQRLTRLQQQALDWMTWAWKLRERQVHADASDAIGALVDPQHARAGRQHQVATAAQPADSGMFAALLQHPCIDAPVDELFSWRSNPEVEQLLDSGRTIFVKHRHESPDQYAREILQHLALPKEAAEASIVFPALIARLLKRNLSEQVWTRVREHVSAHLDRCLRTESNSDNLGAVSALLVELREIDLANTLFSQLVLRHGKLGLSIEDQRICLASLARLAFESVGEAPENAAANACLYLIEEFRATDLVHILIPGAIISTLGDKKGLLRMAPEHLFVTTETGISTRAGVRIGAIVKALATGLTRLNVLGQLAEVVPELLGTGEGEAFVNACVDARHRALYLRVEEQGGMSLCPNPGEDRIRQAFPVPLSVAPPRVEKAYHVVTNQSWATGRVSRFPGELTDRLHQRRARPMADAWSSGALRSTP